VLAGQLEPGRLVLMSSALHRRAERREAPVRAAARLAALPGIDRVASHAARLAFRPTRGPALSAAANPAASDLVRHATMDLGGNVNRARAWSKAVRRWPAEQPELRDAYPLIRAPVLLLWADGDAAHPLAIAEEALELLPLAMLRVLPGTGFLLAYDDPVGMARELAAFCL